MFTPINIYCERLGTGFWAEPLNAISNISFLIAAFLAWRLYREYVKNGNDTHILVLIVLVGVVGIGSFLFHTYATVLMLIADIVPIMLFAFYYLAVAMKRVMDWSGWQTTFGVGAFILFFYFFGNLFPDDALNHSVVYLPFGFALLALSIIAWFKNVKISKQYFIAFGLFSAALFFRTVDMEACSIVPFGTHFLWHIINGGMFYLLLKTLISVQMPKNHTEVEFSV
ncbi:MAG: ceramidase domain-containing protein [Deltaproteobacteria bacterium]|nr:ceramidase domain-containing protein [Deltaproteobacteria bacterium]